MQVCTHAHVHVYTQRLKINMEAGKMAWSVKVLGTKFDDLNQIRWMLHGGRRELITKSCSLTSVCVCYGTCAPHSQLYYYE